MLRFIPLLMTLTVLLTPLSVGTSTSDLEIYIRVSTAFESELELRCRDDSGIFSLDRFSAKVHMMNNNDNSDLEHHFWLTPVRDYEILWEPEQNQFNLTRSHYRVAPQLYEHDSKQLLMPKHLNDLWYLHALHATGTRLANARSYYYCHETDHFQLLAIHNRFSLYTGLELISVKETYSRWTTKSAITYPNYWYEDTWHHPLRK